MDSRLSEIEWFVIFLGVKKILKNKENFILMYSRISRLELCVSIKCENFRREYLA